MNREDLTNTELEELPKEILQIIMRVTRKVEVNNGKCTIWRMTELFMILVFKITFMSLLFALRPLNVAT